MFANAGLWVIAGRVGAFESAPPDAPPPDSPFVHRVTTVDSEGRLVWFERRPDGQVEIGNLVVGRSGTREAWIGRVEGVSDAQLSARVGGSGDLPVSNSLAAIVPRDTASRYRERLPAETTLWGRVDRISPGGKTVWIEGGGDDGFRSGDRVLVVRAGIPIARLELKQIYSRAALAACLPLASNAAIAEGDGAMLWPSPSDRLANRLQSHVLRVQPTRGGDEIWICGERRDGLALGEEWEIRREGRYVALAEVRRFAGHFAIASPLSAFSALRAEPGDVALRRLESDIFSGRVPLRVFRVEDRYCLLNAGERDGIEVGMPLAFESGPKARELRVDTVKVDYCGASLTESAATSRPRPIRQWESVFPLRLPETDRMRGVVASVNSEEGVVTMDGQEGRSGLNPGDLVRISSAPPAAGLVVYGDEHGCILFVPDCWGLRRVRVGCDIVAASP
ncbi:MAG: hypothetical protein O7F76_08390 [Planctomycetota bacterium]|nr:hypothetical protein [Planctomycetota bacterium]